MCGRQITNSDLICGIDWEMSNPIRLVVFTSNYSFGLLTEAE